MIKSGDIRELSITNDEYGSRVIECKSGEDGNVIKGGFYSNDDDGNITTAGQRINQLNRKPWELEVTAGADEGLIDYLTDIAGSESVVTATFMNGEVRSGKGTPVGTMQENKQAGTMSVKFQGSGTFELI